MSNFGQSALRPTLGLVFLTAGFGYLYSKLALNGNYWDAFEYSSSKLGGVIPWPKSSSAIMENSLFITETENVLIEAHRLAAVEGTLSFLLFALIILAVRNRFKMK